MDSTIVVTVGVLRGSVPSEVGYVFCGLPGRLFPFLLFKISRLVDAEGAITEVGVHRQRSVECRVVSRGETFQDTPLDKQKT